MKLPRVGHTVYDQDGKQITIILASRYQTRVVASCWHRGKIALMELRDDGTLIDKSDVPLNEILMPFFKKSWNYNRRKAKLKQKRVRFLTNLAKRTKVHFITAKVITAKAHLPGEYKEPSYLESLSGSCSASAMADAQMFVSARVIEDPNNPENNGRTVQLKMPKSRVDGLYQLAKDLKEIK